MAKIKYTVETPYQTYHEELEIPDDELAEQDDRERFITSVVEEAVGNIVSWGWEEV